MGDAPGRDDASSLWRGAWRGVRAGYTRTKGVLRRLPGGRRGPSRRSSSPRDGPSDPLETPSDEGRGAEGEERSALGSSDEVTRTEEPVWDVVEAKYFDKRYDAMREELTGMAVTYTRTAAEDRREREAAEAKVRVLRHLCQMVSATLKRRILHRQASFMHGVEGIREISDRLLQTSSECKRHRQALRKAKAAVMAPITLLARHRTRGHARATLALLEAMASLHDAHRQLLALLSSGQLVEARALLAAEGPLALESQLERLPCLRTAMDEWRRYREDAAALGDRIEPLLTTCLTVKFVPETYRNTFESAAAFHRVEETTELIVLLLWRTAVQILTKSLLEVSERKDETASIADLAQDIHPDHLLLCLCQMSARMVDFMYLFRTVQRLHQEAADGASASAPLHAALRPRLRDVGRRMALDMVEKVTLVLSHAPLGEVDVDRGLHLFLLLSTLIEATAALGLAGEEQASARAQVMEVVLRYLGHHFHAVKAIQILDWMGEDAWSVSPVAMTSLSIVCRFSTAAYEAALRAVTRYLDEAEEGAVVGAPPRSENPFYSHDLLLPWDTAALVQTEHFGTYWERSAAGASEERCPDSAARETASPPTLLTASAMAVAHTFLEYEARVLPRFPPLAEEVLRWCEDLLGVYVYTVADTFASLSTGTPVEQQAGLSRDTRAVLASLREAGERAVEAVEGVYRPVHPRGGRTSATEARLRYPPRVWTGSGRAARGGEAAPLDTLEPRAVACASAVSLVHLYEAVLNALAPQLPAAAVEAFRRRCQGMHRAVAEVLHVGLHRLARALFPLEAVCGEIQRLRPGKEAVRVSGYVETIRTGLRALQARRARLPTAALERLFLHRLVFAVQDTLVGAYARGARRRPTDPFIMQLQVDAQTFHRDTVEALGRESLVLPDHVMGLVQTGFFRDEWELQREWLRRWHANYEAADLIHWFAGRDRAAQSRLEALLAEEDHHDVLPMARFGALAP